MRSMAFCGGLALFGARQQGSYAARRSRQTGILHNRLFIAAAEENSVTFILKCSRKHTLLKMKTVQSLYQHPEKPSNPNRNGGERILNCPKEK